MEAHNLDKEIEYGLARANQMLQRQQKLRFIYLFLGLCALVGAFFLGFLLRPTSNSLPMTNSGLYFSSNRSGKYEISYLGPDGKIMQITHTELGQSWGATLSPNGIVYFVSDRDGKSDIYALHADEVVRVTISPGNSRSWEPVPTLGGLYFVSNRSGKNEIYFLDSTGLTHQITNTPGLGESQFSVGK